jgi:hypothetical protein
MQTFELWVEGGGGNGYGTLRAHKVADIKGDDFIDAVDRYVDELEPREARLWEYCPDDDVWKWCGQHSYDNEADARTIYG